MIRIEPYKRWSGGAKALGKRAGILRATDKQVAKYGDFTHIINWGNSERRFNGEYINTPEAVGFATCKLRTHDRLAERDVPQPDYTTSRTEAQLWNAQKEVVVVRGTTRGHSGQGITIVSSPMPLPEAPLYTKYIKKAEEYRVHVFGGEVIDVQMKRRRIDVPDEEVNWQIRNHHNGWIFARDGVDPPSCVISAAIKSVNALGLDFGAVDIGFNRNRGAAVVYEVNTAPGLEGTTLEKYYEAILKLFPQLRTGMYAKRRAA